MVAGGGVLSHFRQFLPDGTIEAPFLDGLDHRIDENQAGN
jgi:hypothetical protein